LGKQSLAGARRAYEKHIAFLQFKIAAFLGYFQALVVVVNSDGQLLLGYLLADDVEIEEFLYFLRLREFLSDGRGHNVVRDDFIADIDAFIAYIDGRAGNELFDVVLAFGTEGTSKDIISLVVFSQRSPPGFGWVTLLFS
jgi:hypothetical protein